MEKDDNDDDDGWQLDDDGWQDLPIVHTDELRGGLDEEDQRKYLHRVNASASASGGGGRGSKGEGRGVGGVGRNAIGTTDESGYR